MIYAKNSFAKYTKEVEQMSFFTHMEGIVYNNYSQFMHAVDDCRSSLIKADRELLLDKGIIVDIEKPFELSDGRLTLKYKGMKADCFFHYKPNKRLYVFLNGAKAGEKPKFARWSYYKFLNGSVLNISDPMYNMYEDLILGWYYGDNECNLRICISEIVRIVALKLGVKNEQIFFYGSSGGGAAVFECASHITGAKGVAINPQIVLSEYDYAGTFERITNNNLKNDKVWHRNNGIYYLLHNRENKYIIMCNLRSKEDMRQVDNICKELKINVKYGLNLFNNLIIWLFDCECMPYIDAHNLQDNYCICFALEKLLENFENQENIMQQEPFYRYINEWWYAWWINEKRIRKPYPNLHYLVECTKMKKRIALFGAGNDAQKLSNDLLDISGENYYRVEIILDNDSNKAGSTFCGITVMHPDSEWNWSDLFIIISTTKYVSEIERQLEGYGLVYKKDFIFYSDLYDSNASSI